ncbi:putative lipoprotein, partial [Acinetobacter pittii]
MNILFKTTVLAASLLLVACNDNDDQEAQTAPSTNQSKYYQTKTPYQPQQEIK